MIFNENFTKIIGGECLVYKDEYKLEILKFGDEE